MDLHFSSYTIAIAMIKLFILILTGYVLYSRKFIGEKFLDTLSLLLVRVLFPALIVSKTVTHFSFGEYPYWWILPIAAVIFSLAGMLIGYVIFGFLKGFDSRREFMCSCGFQNCGYLPMNLVLFSFAGQAADRLLIYIFLFIMGFNLLVWSVLPLFLSGKLKKGFKPRALLTPPVIATVFSLIWVSLFGKGSMPHLALDPLKQLGQAAFPLTMIILGAFLCRYRALTPPPQNKMPLVAAVVAKLFLFPALVLLALKLIAWDGLLKSML